MKKNHIIIAILVITTILFGVLYVKELNNNETTKCKSDEVRDTDLYSFKEFDMDKITFNGLKLGDSSKKATLIMDSNYKSLKGVDIRDTDSKIVELKIYKDIDKVLYEDKKMDSIETIIDMFGQYQKKVTLYNKESKSYEYIYEKGSIEEHKGYTLTISCDEKNNINFISLEVNQLMIMG